MQLWRHFPAIAAVFVGWGVYFLVVGNQQNARWLLIVGFVYAVTYLVLERWRRG
jgi:hypothetical protein